MRFAAEPVFRFFAFKQLTSIHRGADARPKASVAFLAAAGAQLCRQAAAKQGRRWRDGIAPNIAANVAIVVLQAAQRALMSRRPIMRAGVGRRQRPERLSRSRPSIATLSP